jgi:hypothetical protein
MDMNQAHRMANLYDASWEIVNEGASGAPLAVATRTRFVSCWGPNATGKDDETLIHWAKNFLRHNGRPNV